MHTAVALVLVLGVLGLDACRPEAERHREQISTCIYISPGAVGPCLVTRYHWTPAQAMGAIADIRLRADSIRDAENAKQAEYPHYDYRKVSQQGSTITVSFDPVFARDTMRLHQFGANLCQTAASCTVVFRPDTTLARVWNNQHLTPAAATNLVAEYRRSPAEGERVVLGTAR